jgi:poly(beta-D-mannuronate) lyase
MASRPYDRKGGSGLCSAIALGVLLAFAGAAAGAACPTGAPVVRDIAAEAFYTDARHSIADPAILKRNHDALQPLDRALGAIVARSNTHFRNGSPDDAVCALTLLAEQARGGAMLGATSSMQAGYERKWRTAGMAIVHLALRRYADPEQRAAIEPWLAALADRVEATDTRLERWNNHHYWIGLVATAVGAATDDSARFARGRRIFDDGLAAIAADGTLPRELERGVKALHYHAYAAAPLVLSAEIASWRGEDWWSRRDHALRRLVDRVAAGIADPDRFSQLVGVPVEIPTGGTIAWAAFVERRFADAPRFPPGPRRQSWLGGDLAALAAARSAGTGDATGR